MSKYKKKTTAGKVLGVLVALVLIALVGGLIYKLTNGFASLYMNHNPNAHKNRYAKRVVTYLQK